MRLSWACLKKWRKSPCWSSARKSARNPFKRYGATSFGYGWEDTDEGQRAVVFFKKDGRSIRFDLPMPNREDCRHTPERGYWRDDNVMSREFEKGCRQWWRALVLVIKAKLEAVDSGITTFDSEFLAHMMLPGGQTVADTVLPQLDEVYEHGVAPSLLVLDKTPPGRLLSDHGAIEPEAKRPHGGLDLTRRGSQNIQSQRDTVIGFMDGRVAVFTNPPE